MQLCVLFRSITGCHGCPLSRMKRQTERIRVRVASAHGSQQGARWVQCKICLPRQMMSLKDTNVVAQRGVTTSNREHNGKRRCPRVLLPATLFSSEFTELFTVSRSKKQKAFLESKQSIRLNQAPTNPVLPRWPKCSSETAHGKSWRVLIPPFLKSLVSTTMGCDGLWDQNPRRMGIWTFRASEAPNPLKLSGGSAEI